MKAYINHHLFTENPVDSGALTMACSVVHNFSEPGTYAGSIIAGTRTSFTFHLLVDDKYPALQANIDLADTPGPAAEGCDCKTERAGGPHFEVNPKGFVVFYVSRGPGGFAVRVTGKLKTSDKPAVFDSRELTEGDIFAVSLLRPGTHTVMNSTGAKGKIVVGYPGSKKGRDLYNRAKPLEIRCTEKEFIPKEIEVEAAQGQVYRIETKSRSRIRIELAKADDGPKVARPSGIFAWQKPPAPKTPRGVKQASSSRDKKGS
jgi:hypothetical protein